LNQISNSSFNLKTYASSLASSIPELSDLSSEQLEIIAKLVVTDKLKEKLKKAVDFSSIDYQNEKQKFLDSTSSIQTYRSYSNALKKLENFVSSISISILELSTSSADDFITHLKKQDFSSATIRQTIAGCSSFFSFLERRFNNKEIIIQNPFRGTKLRPKKKLVRSCLYPTASEVQMIIDFLPTELSVIVYLMAFRGFRSDAFLNMSIHGKIFITTSKGKEIAGELSDSCIKKLKSLPKNCVAPNLFSHWNAHLIQQQVRYYISKLFNAGKIPTVYSVHDFRHFFATQEYEKNKDIYRLSKLLNHSSIAVTENYLRGLNVVV